MPNTHRTAVCRPTLKAATHIRIPVGKLRRTHLHRNTEDHGEREYVSALDIRLCMPFQLMRGTLPRFFPTVELPVRSEDILRNALSMPEDITYQSTNFFDLTAQELHWLSFAELLFSMYQIPLRLHQACYVASCCRLIKCSLGASIPKARVEYLSRAMSVRHGIVLLEFKYEQHLPLGTI